MSGTTETLRLLVVVLIVGNVLAFAAGLSLLLAPKKIAKWLGLHSTHPLSIRRLTRPLGKPRDSERVMLRYPRVLGVAMLAGGVFVLLKWSFFIASISVIEGARTLMQLFPRTSWPIAVWEMFWIASLFLVLLGAVLAMLVGGLALIRVQTLKNFSSLTSRWISTRQMAKPVARPYYGIDRLVGEHPQAWGGVITLLSVYTLLMILWSARA